MDERAKSVYQAKLAEQIERYDDMVTSMKQVARMDKPLSVEERNLFSVAFKNVVGTKRTSWRVLQSLENKKKGDDERKCALAKECRLQVEQELDKVCGEVLEVIENDLLKHALKGEGTDDTETIESLVFYYKMQGDYNRYLAEIASNEKRDSLKEKSEEAYGKATEKAKSLKPTHPIRLGLALNFSVFYYEIASDQVKACEMAKTAFDEAIEALDKLAEDSYKDSTLIMQLLRDNLTLWSADNSSTYVNVFVQ
jgi:hypothetical protein